MCATSVFKVAALISGLAWNVEERKENDVEGIGAQLRAGNNNNDKKHWRASSVYNNREPSFSRVSHDGKETNSVREEPREQKQHRPILTYIIA